MIKYPGSQGQKRENHSCLPGVTPCGRVAGTKLRHRRRERVARELAAGCTIEEAYRLAGLLDSTAAYFRENCRRDLWRHPEIREREAEIAAIEIHRAGIHSVWILGDIKNIARASITKFWKRDDRGQITVDDQNQPVWDFTQASEDDLRTIAKFRHTKEGFAIELHDALAALDKLGRHKGLWSDKVALTGLDGKGPPVMRVEFVRANEGRIG